MKLKLCILLALAVLTGFGSLQAQRYKQEIGIIAGPLQFRSDYGLRNNVNTNLGNTGIGIGIVHYSNFIFKENHYWQNHFKIRSEIDYHFTNLNHYGILSRKNSIGGRQLRAMHGKASVVEIGPSLEWYPSDTKEFEYANAKFAPYLSLGIHLVHYKPSAKTDLPGRIGSFTNTFPAFLAPTGEAPYINTRSGFTYAITASMGSRYKLNRDSDLVLDFRLHYYGSDFVDGLNAYAHQNRFNDWIAWMNVGYIYYFEF